MGVPGILRLTGIWRGVAGRGPKVLRGFSTSALIEPGSTVHTDGWQGYAGLEKKGYDHEVTPVRQRPRKKVSTLHGNALATLHMS
jgi:hypothetical protein